VLASFSLAGVPPLSGFFGKLGLVQVGLNEQQWLIVGVSAAVSLFTLFSMLKIWNEVFWKKAYDTDVTKLPRASFGLLAPGAVLVAVSIAIGIFAGPIMDYSARSANQVLDLPGLISDVCGAPSCEPPVGLSR
jgi:multicomponent Na+:H+ antiporter subunit D